MVNAIGSWPAMVRRFRTVAGVAIVSALAGCQDSQGPLGSQSMAADLSDTKQVLFMTLTQQGGTVNGTAQLKALTAGSEEAMIVTGTRVADTVAVTFQRAQKASFAFKGWFVSNGRALSGTLDGAEFSKVAAQFNYQ